MRLDPTYVVSMGADMEKGPVSVDACEPRSIQNTRQHHALPLPSLPQSSQVSPAIFLKLVPGRRQPVWEETRNRKPKSSILHRYPQKSLQLMRRWTPVHI